MTIISFIAIISGTIYGPTKVVIVTGLGRPNHRHGNFSFLFKTLYNSGNKTSLSVVVNVTDGSK